MEEVDDYQAKILAEAKEFAAERIAPIAGEIDRSCEFPSDLLAALRQRGYLGATFPQSYGGLGLDPIGYGLLTEIIGKACSSTRALMTVHNSLVGEALLRWGTQDQRDYWAPQFARGEKIAAFALTEPNVGTDANSVETSYKEIDNAYQITGKKKWITFSGLADVFLVVARQEQQVTAFLVDRWQKGVTVTPMRELLASRGCHISEIDFQTVTVPKENVLGGVGNGFKYVASTALDHGRYSIAWGALALAQAALEEMATYATKRKQFGKPIYEHQLVRGMIGDAVTKVHAARTLCLQAGRLRKRKSPDAIMETTIAKYFTSKVAVDVASDAVQVHGGNGCYGEFPVARLFRESKIMEIIEGTSQIQQIIIGKYGAQAYARRERV